jgi:hypothetical protein
VDGTRGLADDYREALAKLNADMILQWNAGRTLTMMAVRWVATSGA